MHQPDHRLVYSQNRLPHLRSGKRISENDNKIGFLPVDFFPTYLKIATVSKRLMGKKILGS